jgi:hypothetical protein
LIIVVFIKLVEEATWLSLIVIIPEKNANLIIYVDFTKLNVTIKKNLWPLFFIDEVINTMVRHEVYTFSKTIKFLLCRRINKKLPLLLIGELLSVLCAI